MKIKKWLSVVLAGVMAISMNMVALAAESTQNNLHSVAIKELATKYQVTEDEIVHMDENIKSALAKASNAKTMLQAGDNTEQVIPISENLRLVVSTQAEAPSSLATVYRTTITSTFVIENVIGMDIVTLKSVGVFERDGSTCVPVDAYGTYNTFVWSVTDVASELGDAAYNAWVRNTFDGECNIGIDPVSMTIFTFSYSCTIDCDANGNYSADWT